MGPVQQTNSGHVFRVLGPVQKTKLRTGIQCHGASSTNKTQDMYAGHGAGSTNKTQDIIQGHGAGSTSKTQDMYSGSWGRFNKQNSGHVFKVMGPVQQTKFRTCIQGHGAGSTSKTQDMYSGSWAMLLLKRQIFVLAREIAVDLLGNNRRSSEIQGTALGKSLPAWTCIYIYIDRDCYYIYIGPCLRV